MGHYYSEMMCEKCGNVRCTCPPKPSKQEKGWIVDDNFTVITVKEFDEKHRYQKLKYGYIEINPLLSRMDRKIHTTRKAAEQAAAVQCEACITRLQEQLDDLRARALTEPWKS